jgi:hypothetical protein
MTSRFAIPLEQITLDLDGVGYHLPEDAFEVLENSGTILPSDHLCPSALFEEDHPKTSVVCLAPPNPSQFGYSIIVYLFFFLEYLHCPHLY